MSARASAWSVTINNPTKDDEEYMNLARQKGWKVEGQLERGEQGTPHYQLLVKTPQVRFSAVKKAFPRAHIEVARNVAALEQYVNKEETREGELPVQQERYPSLSRLWELFADWVSDHRLTLAKETWNEDQWLFHFDMFIRDSIIDGYFVESMAVNPQVRGCVKKYGREILIRVQNIGRQTDRQTDSMSEASEIISWHEENADDSSSSRSS